MKHLLTILAAVLFGAFSFAQTVEFEYTGQVQPYVIPENVTSISVELYGASGGYSRWENGFYPEKYRPGQGGMVSATYPVTPGETIYVFVGGKGENATNTEEGKGGFNGGGDGNNTGTYGPYCGGGGGGASDIRMGGPALSDRVLVAGGAGGAGSNYPDGGDHGGDGGGKSAADGRADNKTNHESCGLAADQHSGGIGGQWSGYLKGEDGTLGRGGHAPDSTAGGGGGGGYYGGGAGSWSGGGGGSSFTAPAASHVQHQQGVHEGDGKVIITLHLGTVAEKPALINEEAEPEVSKIIMCDIQIGEEETWEIEEVEVIQEVEIIEEEEVEQTTANLTEEQPHFIIYPNPTNGRLVIQGDDVHAIAIYALNGELVFSSNYKKELDVSELSPGTYIVHIKDANNSIMATEPIVIQ